MMARNVDNAVVITVDRSMFLPGIVVAEELATVPECDRYEVIVLAEKGSVPAEFGAWHDRRGGGFSITEVDFAAMLPKNAQVTQRFPEASIFCLRLPEYFAGRYRRILYLDADTEVIGPVGRLFDLDLSGATVAAADDLTPPGVFATTCVRSTRTQELRKQAGLKPSANCRYANSGVLLIDSEAWLQRSISEQALKFLAEHRGLCKFPDQDALNAVLPETYCLLSPTWNFRADIVAFRPLRPKVIEPTIIHYSGDNKPWFANLWRGDPEATKRYARYFAGTPWPDGPSESEWLDHVKAEIEQQHIGESRLRRNSRRIERQIRNRRRQIIANFRQPSDRKQRHFEDYLCNTLFADIAQGLARPFNGMANTTPTSDFSLRHS